MCTAMQKKIKFIIRIYVERWGFLVCQKKCHIGKYDMFKIDTFCVTLRAIVRFFSLQRFFGPLAQNSFVNLVLYTQVIVICMGLPKNIIYLCIDYFIFLYCMHKILPLLWFFVKVSTK